jgi:hypothetical protein
VVSLFQPFLWKRTSPTMGLSALEAAYFLYLTIRILWRVGLSKPSSAISRVPVLTLCFVFQPDFR